MPEKSWFGLATDDATAPVDVALFGVPYDAGVFFRRGAAEAPARLRELSYRLPPVKERMEGVSHKRIADLGDVAFGDAFEDVGADAMKDAAGPIAEMFRLTKRRGLPLAIGGDHSVSIPLLRAAAEGVPELGILWIDAHPDLCDSFHGSELSHACVLRRALEQPSIRPENVMMIGIRSFEVEEVEYIRANHLTALTSEAVSGLSGASVARQVSERFGRIPVYLSIDIDAFDPAFAPGTGIPDAGGLTPRFVLDLLHNLSLNLYAIDIVEVAPRLDTPSDPTSLLALKLILELL